MIVRAHGIDPAMLCPTCPCPHPHPAHAILAALQDGDVDAALERGLLTATPCPDCHPACSQALQRARDVRRFALAARERHRARLARLARWQEERERARRTTANTTSAALPPAAAAALARALAKARARRP
jgi:hypothetical protein